MIEAVSKNSVLDRDTKSKRARSEISSSQGPKRLVGLYEDERLVGTFENLFYSFH